MPLLIHAFALLLAAALPSSSAEGPIFCATCANGGPPPMADTRVTITCADPGATISRVAFASYGTPSGSCPTFAAGGCAAANSTSVVVASCVGLSACVVFPNTTTFGDPCFGTAKVLDVALACTSGTGQATCGVAPTPSLPNFTAAVSVKWTAQTATLRVVPSIQVVSHHALWRTAPQHDQSFATLAQLGANNVRFVPWLPYAQYGVAQLMPPSPHLCGPQNWKLGRQVEPLTLDCGPQGGTISAVDFASFGRATGNCGGYATAPACHAANSSAVVASLCVGKPSCVLPTAAGGIFGTPCAGDVYLAVQVSCSTPATHTYWNFTLVDQFVTDFWAATGDALAPIPNWSTQPTWLYSPDDYNWNADAAQPWGYSRGDASKCNNTALGDYYGRLYGYFKNNAMVDEAGVTHTRTTGPPLDIKIIEVFNEVDYEHGYTKESYTAAFDAVVRGVRTHADPGGAIKFVGLSLPNIDGAQKVVDWAAYFLNASNHAVDIAGSALDFIGYHAYPTNGGYTPDPTSFSRMFDYADDFIAGVKLVDAVIASLSPRTQTVLDETGTDMDGVLGPGAPPGNNPRYWVAAAGYWSYMFARAANESSSVVQVGASQLMDAPGQEPSVTLLDWETGNGTARFWAVRLFVESFPVTAHPAICATTAVSSGGAGIGADALFAMAFEATAARPRQLLLINKRNAFAAVSLQGTSCVSLRVIDEYNGVQPARSEACDASGAVNLAPYATAILEVK